MSRPARDQRAHGGGAPSARAASSDPSAAVCCCCCADWPPCRDAPCEYSPARPFGSRTGWRRNRRGVHTRRRFRRHDMEGHAASLGRHAGLIQRTLQLRLIAQQQGQRLGLLDGDVHPRRRVGRSIDTDFHLAEFGWGKPHGQPLRAVRCMAHRDQRRRNLRGGRCQLRVGRRCGRGAGGRRGRSRRRITWQWVQRQRRGDRHCCWCRCALAGVGLT